MGKNPGMHISEIQWQHALWRRVKFEALKQNISASELVRRATKAALPKELKTP